MFSWRWLWRMPFSGMWSSVVLVWADASEEGIASIFSVEKSANETTCSRWFFARVFFYTEDGGDVPPKCRLTKTVRRHISENGILVIYNSCKDDILCHGGNILNDWSVFVLAKINYARRKINRPISFSTALNWTFVDTFTLFSSDIRDRDEYIEFRMFQ
jgi:hypothetical protein